MDQLDSRLRELTNRLHAAGSRITPQRIAILRALLTDERHPTIEEVYERVVAQFPTTSLATVYKTVAMLKEMGEVGVVDMPGAITRYDGLNVAPHPHLVCTVCSRVLDVRLFQADSLRQMVAERSGHWVILRGPYFYGVCPECQRSGQQSVVSDQTEASD